MSEQETTCQYCGKPISQENALEHGAGSRCQELREQGWDADRLAEHKASMSADEVPVTEDGREYVKVAVLHRRLVKEGIPVSRMVRAMGGDRSIDDPAHPHFKPVYVGRARYLHPDTMTEWGFNFLRSMNGRTPTSKDKETAEIEEALADA